MSIHTPSGSEVRQAAIKAALGNLHTAFVAEFVSYNASTGLAEIQPSVHIVNHDTGNTIPRAIIPNVPVMFPQGNGVGIRWEPQAGDKCFCIVNERSIDRWIDSGACEDPQTTRRHDITDALCFPFATEANSPQTNGILIDKDGLVTVGVVATDFVSIGTLVEAELAKIKAAISGALVVAGDGGAAFKANMLTLLAGFPATTKSSNLKAEP